MRDAVEMYDRLADFCNKQSRYQERDRFLVLAMDAAQNAGDIQTAEKYRQRIMSLNPNHLLKPYSSVLEAMRSSDLVAYIHQLRREYPANDQDALIRKLSGNTRSHTPPPGGGPPVPDYSGPASARIRRGVGFTTNEPISAKGPPTMIAPQNIMGPPSYSGPRSAIGITSAMSSNPAPQAMRPPSPPPPPVARVSISMPPPTVPVSPVPDPLEAVPYRYQEKPAPVTTPSGSVRAQGYAPLPARKPESFTEVEPLEGNKLSAILFGIVLVLFVLGTVLVLAKPFINL